MLIETCERSNTGEPLAPYSGVERAEAISLCQLIRLAAVSLSGSRESRKTGFEYAHIRIARRGVSFPRSAGKLRAVRGQRGGRRVWGTAPYM